MNNDSDSPQGQAGVQQPCEHEWVFHRDYNMDNDTERPYAECRLCGKNAGEDTGVIRVHAMRVHYLQRPDWNWEHIHPTPYKFQGTGMNVWYKAHP